jgi:probable phosphoglycerate mutase
MDKPANAAAVGGSTVLYLIRHGQAFVNVEEVIGGMKGDHRGLTPEGIRQAERLRGRLRATGEIKPDVLLASTLPRARQTAEIVAPALGLPITFEDDLQEVRPGPGGDGLTLEQFRRRFGWVAFEDDPHRETDPGGESWVTFVARGCGVLERITTEHAGKTIVAVTHGGIIDTSFLYFFGLDRERVPATGLATWNTSLTRWERVPHRDRMRWRLAAYNDAAHLREIGPGQTIDYGAQQSGVPSHPAEPAPPAEKDA